MSTDLFEDTLRDLLHTSAEAEGGAYLVVEPASVVGIGRRAIRRRRISMGIGGAAVATAISLVGWTVLGAGVDRTSPPAGPATTALTGARVSADLPMAGVAQVRVEVDRSTGHARYLVPRNGRMAVVAEGRVPDTPRAVTWVSPASVPGLTVGLMPIEAIERVQLWSEDDGGGDEREVPLPGTGFKAFAMWRGDSAATTFMGLDWTDGQHFYNSAGDELPGGRSGEALAFVDRSLGSWGYLLSDGITTGLFRELRAGELPVLLTGQDAGGGEAHARLLVVLPSGATGVRIEPDPDATLTSLDTFSGTAGRSDESLVMARITAPIDIVSQGLGKITWTNADGSAGAGSLSP